MWNWKCQVFQKSVRKCNGSNKNYCEELNCIPYSEMRKSPLQIDKRLSKMSKPPGSFGCSPVCPNKMHNLSVIDNNRVTWHLSVTYKLPYFYINISVDINIYKYKTNIRRFSVLVVRNIAGNVKCKVAVSQRLLNGNGAMTQFPPPSVSSQATTGFFWPLSSKIFVRVTSKKNKNQETGSFNDEKKIVALGAEQWNWDNILHGAWSISCLQKVMGE